MGLFNRKSKENITDPTPISDLVPGVASAENKVSSYIHVQESERGNWYLSIKGGNHKVRLVSETYYTRPNVLRAAKLLSQDTGFRIVDEGVKK